MKKTINNLLWKLFPFWKTRRELKKIIKEKAKEERKTYEEKCIEVFNLMHVIIDHQPQIIRDIFEAFKIIQEKEQLDAMETIDHTKDSAWLENQDEE
jgi:hypothetical protein